MPDSSSSGKPGLLRRLWGGSPEKTRTVRLPVHAYGKLPIYKDFISSGMTDPPAQEFRAWLDKGFSHRWSSDENCRETEIPPHSFLLRMPVSKGYAAGSLWGSSDEGGLRKFPFALFFSFAKDHGAADPVAAVEYLGEVERRASELRFLFGPGSSLSSFYQAYRGAELDLALNARDQIVRDFRSELSAFSVGEFAESLFGEEAAASWAALLAAAGAGADGPGAVRIPLGGRLPRAREVEFWLFWLGRQDPRGRRPVTGVLYPHGHNPGRATFFFRDIRPEDFLLLHPTRTDLPQVLEPLGRATPWTPPPSRAAARSTPSANAPVVRTPAVEAPPVASVAPMDVGGSVAPPAPAPQSAAVSDLPAESAAVGAAVAAPPPPPLPAVELPVESSIVAPPAPLSPEPLSPEPLSEEESPFPEADLLSDPTAGVRLSQVLVLDLDRPENAASRVEEGIRTVESPQALPAPPKAESSEIPVSPLPPEPEPRPLASSSPVVAPPVSIPAALTPPASPTPEALPAAAPDPVSVGSVGVSPPTELTVSGSVPDRVPVPAPVPARPPVPRPPGWERPLAVLLEP